MKKYKNILVISLCFLMLVTMVSCTRGDKNSDGKKKVAVLLPGPTGYFVAVREGIDKAAKEYNLDIIYGDAEWDASKQLTQAEDFISKKVDMIAICAADTSGAEKIVKIANEAKIPILAFTNSIGGTEDGYFEGLVSYVGQIETETGGLTGKIAKKLLGENGGKAVLIEGVPGTSPQIFRNKGLKEELKGSNVEIIFNQTSNWEKEQALSITEDLLQQKKEFNIVICQDDNSAIGVGQALKEAGKKDEIKVIGLGGSKDGLKAIKDGLIDATTYMSAVEEGHLAIETVSKSLNGEKVEPVTKLTQVEVNAENVEKFEGEW